MTTRSADSGAHPGRVGGKVAIVTGGASGIGLATAKLLARHGARVVIADVDASLGERAAAAIGSSARFFALDVTNEARWVALMEDVMRIEGTLHILVNNAGIGNQPRSAYPDEAALEDWQAMMKINGEGVFLGCKHGIAAMRRGGGGAIVNMSSIAGLIASPPFAAYGFSKAGVAQLTKTVALYCAQKGLRIRCNSIHPGMIQTRMLDGLFAKVAAESGSSAKDVRSQFLGRVPLGEIGEPDDIANAVLYLASEEAKHVTGTQLVVDGGMTLI
jgi:NAD(P)-dependent dehydrogenase (short-subunit alcohol dehydrogenase family)